MGQVVRAKCDKCRYRAEATVGAGMLTFREHAWFPAKCRACRRMVDIDLLAAELRCPRCTSPDVTPYDYPSLRASPGTTELASWCSPGWTTPRIITDGRYVCPHCGEGALRFETGMMFD